MQSCVKLWSLKIMFRMRCVIFTDFGRNFEFSGSFVLIIDVCSNCFSVKFNIQMVFRLFVRSWRWSWEVEMLGPDILDPILHLILILLIYTKLDVKLIYLNSTLNYGIPPVLVFQLEVYCNVDRLQTGLTAQKEGTNARWYSNKTSLTCFKNIILYCPNNLKISCKTLFQFVEQ